MSTVNVYVINALLVLLVIRQIREHPLDLRSLAIPVLAVGVAAFFFLHSVPLGGNDIALELACVLTGALMGAIGGFAPYLRRGADGRPPGRAGWVGAREWVCARGGGRGTPRVQRRQPHHRRGRLDRGPDHDGAGRRADPAGDHLPARTPADGERPGSRRPDRGWRRCLTW